MSHRKHKARRSQPAATVPMSNVAAADALQPTVAAEPPVADATTRIDVTAAAPIAVDPVTTSEPAAAPSAEAEHGAPDVTPSASEMRLEPATDSAANEAARIGHQLQVARATKGLELAAVAHELRLPLRVLEKLEAGDWAGIDSPLYLRGYLRSYSQLLDIPTPVISATAPTLPSAPPLVSTAGMPRSHYLLRRYATGATYVGLTALVVVPVILLGLQGGLKPELATSVPLDPPVVVTVPQSLAPAHVTPAPDAAPANTSAAEDGKPLMASMAPMGLLDRELDTDAAAPSAAAVAGQRSLDLHLDAPSWVEILADDGTRIEYALLQPGDHHYSTTGAVDVRLGNSQDASLTVDGQAQDFASYRHANVAHFSVDAEGSVQPPRG